MTWRWEDEEQLWRHINSRPAYSVPHSDSQFMAAPSTYYQNPIGSTQVAPMYPSNLGSLSHGLPALSSLPIRATTTMRTDGLEVPRQQQTEVRPQPGPRSASSRNYIEASRSHPQAATLSKKQVQRQDELKDEVYPLKLVRGLDRISGRLPHVNKGKPVFGVIHVNNSVENGLTVENVSTYSSVRAANYRALDFWDRKYGTRMFTEVSRSAETDTTSLKFENIEDLDGQFCHVSQGKKLNYRLSGGVPTNSSQWVIDNKCLSLNHDGEGEYKKVYVVISHVQDQGIHA